MDSYSNDTKLLLKMR